MARRKARKKEESSLRIPGRRVAIVSTAAIPWMTGTAVNPLLRAAYMAKCTELQVTLIVPWLAKCDQELTFIDGVTFDTPDEQEEFMGRWITKRTGLTPKYKVKWYSGRYDRTLLGIFQVGNLTSVAEEAGAEVIILEEPEHLTWYHHGPRWTEKFDHVVGIIHTSYRELSRRNSGILMAGISVVFNSLLCSIHCHKVVKLSDTVQAFPRSVVCCVHGAAPKFLEYGDAKSKLEPGVEGRRFAKGAYCLGKIVYGKGWEELLTLLDFHQRHTHESQADVNHPTIDAYGSGEAFEHVKGMAEKLGVQINWLGRRDHLDPMLQDYQVFINASTSDVVATTSMEALAMGKWLICAQHPCNAFVGTFSNCLIYRSPEEFSAHLEHALKEEPPPLSPSELRELGWEAATERMLDAGSIAANEWPGPISTAQEAMAWSLYNSVTGIEPLRVAINAGSHTRDAPADMLMYDPLESPCQNVRHSAWGWFLSLQPQLLVSFGCDLLRVGLGRDYSPGWSSGWPTACEDSMPMDIKSTARSTAEPARLFA